MDFQDEQNSQPIDMEPQTQTQSQALDDEPSSQELASTNEHLWGYLKPLSADMRQIDLFKPQVQYKVGRSTVENSIILPAHKISNRHAEITWDGKETTDSTITIKDLSSNGTFINGRRIGRGETRIVRDGNEVSFGSTSSSKKDQDYRFIFRHNATGKPPTEGFYAIYDTGTQLGQGSFASVVRCVERSTGLWWAAKMFADPLGAKDGSRSSKGSRSDKMVSREIAILEKLSHPNICFLKDTFLLDDGKLILVLELIEGGDLLEYILSNGGISEDLAQKFTYELCLALAYIHSLGIAHRDLKPENVLLTKDNPPCVKVADFGLAKATDSQTMLRTMCGTPAYLAPEVVSQTNMEGYDHLVDSWSVGVIVFSMLTNSSPFIEDENQRDVRTRIITRTIDWGVIQSANVSEDATNFIERLLMAEPDARMTLSGALDHPWLVNYAQSAGRDRDADRQLGRSNHPSNTAVNGAARGAARNGSGSQIFSQGFENMRLGSVAGPSSNVPEPDLPQSQPNVSEDEDMDQSSTPPPTSSQRRRLMPENSRVLRRRKDVLDEDAENSSSQLPCPSPELLSQFADNQKRQKAAKNGDAGSSSGGKQAGKRPHQDLSPVPEGRALSSVGRDVSMAEGGEQGSMDSGLNDAQPTPSKRARNSAPKTTPSARNTAKRAKKEAEPVRRSARNKKP